MTSSGTRQPGGIRSAALSSVAASVGILVSLLVSGALAARMLGPTDRGFYALVGLVPSVVCQLAGLGVSLAVAHFVAAGRVTTFDAVRLLRGWVAWQVGISWLLALVIGVALQYGQPTYVVAAAIVSSVTVLSSFAKEYGLALVQATGANSAANALRALPQFGTAAAFVVLFVAGAGTLLSVIAVWAVAECLAGLVSAWLAARIVRAEKELVGGGTETSVDRASILRFGKQGYLAYVSPLDTFRLDQLFIGVTMSPAALGYYAAAASFTNVPRTLAHSLGLTAAPFVARERATGRQHDSRATVVFAAVSVFGSVATAVVIAGLAPWLVPWLFGEAFRPSVGVCQVLMLGAAFFAVRRTAVDLLRGIGDARAGLVPEVAGFAAFIAVLVGTGGATPLDVAWAFSLAGAVNLVTVLAMQRARLGRLAKGLRSRRS